MSASTSRSPACSPRAWWCTRPIASRTAAFASPAEIAITADGDRRLATLLDGGAPVEIGPIEKMSKSKRNTVDPDDIIGTYGADTARWFMLSDSPPDRDVIWSEEGVKGASRFVQRLWRIANDAAEIAKSAPAERPAEFGPDAIAVRKAAHGALHKVLNGIERLAFNVSLAHIREFANALADSLGKADKPTPGSGLRDSRGRDHPGAAGRPDDAASCGRVLGSARSGRTGRRKPAWPAVEPALLVEDTITLPVQVNGKKRGDVTVARDAQNPQIEAAVLALDTVKQALDGKPVRKIIIVPQRIVNVVV